MKQISRIQRRDKWHLVLHNSELIMSLRVRGRLHGITKLR